LDRDHFTVCCSALVPGWERVMLGASVWLAPALRASLVVSTASLGGRFVMSTGSVGSAAATSPQPEQLDR